MMGSHRAELIECIGILSLVILLLCSPVGVRVGAASVVNFESGHVRPLVLSTDRQLLFAVNMPDNRLEIFRVTANGLASIGEVGVGLEPVAIAAASARFYDARQSSGHGDSACASCHIFGDFDSLAWDLGDPDGGVEINPIRPAPIPGAGPLSDFHPMKGPMATQSLRGLLGAGVMPWRGDRNGGHDAPFDEDAAFMVFGPALESLLGRATAVPPGSGQWLGLDRDEDGWFNQDEIEAGTNPADPSEVPIPSRP